jgi:redox-sensitive bicupin YhaK (pirin superfamily)
MAQLWVNLPAKYKMSAPKYQGITHSQINKYLLEDGKGAIEVIAGNYENVTGAASTFSPVNMFNARLEKGGKAGFNFPAAYNTALLVVSGEINVNGTQPVAENHFALFENDGEHFSIEATKKTIVLILSGEPLNEPIVAQGPFVMNTREEIAQAIRDYNLGKFGYLEE